MISCFCVCFFPEVFHSLSFFLTFSHLLVSTALFSSHSVVSIGSQNAILVVFTALFTKIQSNSQYNGRAEENLIFCLKNGWKNSILCVHCFWCQNQKYFSNDIIYFYSISMVWIGIQLQSMARKIYYIKREIKLTFSVLSRQTCLVSHSRRRRFKTNVQNNKQKTFWVNKTEILIKSNLFDAFNEIRIQLKASDLSKGVYQWQPIAVSGTRPTQSALNSINAIKLFASILSLDSIAILAEWKSAYDWEKAFVEWIRKRKNARKKCLALDLKSSDRDSRDSKLFLWPNDMFPCFSTLLCD